MYATSWQASLWHPCRERENVSKQKNVRENTPANNTFLFSSELLARREQQQQVSQHSAFAQRRGKLSPNRPHAPTAILQHSLPGDAWSPVANAAKPRFQPWCTSNINTTPARCSLFQTQCKQRVFTMHKRLLSELTLLLVLLTRYFSTFCSD